jgi:hypothetical protein
VKIVEAGKTVRYHETLLEFDRRVVLWIFPELLYAFVLILVLDVVENDPGRHV